MRVAYAKCCREHESHGSGTRKHTSRVSSDAGGGQQVLLTTKRFDQKQATVDPGVDPGVDAGGGQQVLRRM